MIVLTRRAALAGALSSLGGCGTLATLNEASEPLDTYDLLPAAGSSGGRRTSRTLLVAKPQTSAALATDRIMIKPGPAAITYLPDARWSDELPSLLQSLLVRSVSETGRVAYVGRTDAGPIPDKALLVRIDAFEVQAQPDQSFEVRIDIDLTIINDKDQRVVATRRFAQSVPATEDTASVIVAAFQDLLNTLLPDMADWAIGRV